MKNFLIIIIGIFVLVGATYFVLLYSSEKLDRLALSETKKIITEIERFKSTNNKFPDDIHIFLDTNGFKRKIRFGFLSTEIKLYRHEGSHIIQYHQSPFGPFYGYNFKSKDWYYTE